MNKKRLKSYALAVALCGLLVSILGCENATTSPIGGAENSSLSDFVGKTYKSQHNEEFSISSDGTIKLGYAGNFDTQGKIIGSKIATTGTVYLLECSHHNSSGEYQYPHSSNNHHTPCLLPIHIRSINGKTVEWAQFWKTLDGKGTTCFASGSKAKAQEYLDFSKWDPPMGYSTGTVVR